MPVYTCSGPDCKRLISVSNIPGGNPVASTDPEGFAADYLQCQSCKKYFCDRSLVALKTTMIEKSCPSCKGLLFNPNAASGPSQRINVTVVGKSLLFPNICACCGGPSNSTYSVTGSNTTYAYRTKTTTTTRWPISSCTKCDPHIGVFSFESSLKPTDIDQIKPTPKDFFSAIVGSVALGFFTMALIEGGPLRYSVPRDLHSILPVIVGAVFLLLSRKITSWKVSKRKQAAITQNEAVKKDVERLALAKNSRGVQCCRPGKGWSPTSYVFRGSSHQFTFHRQDFADAFVKLNKPSVVSVENFS